MDQKVVSSITYTSDGRKELEHDHDTTDWISVETTRREEVMKRTNGEIVVDEKINFVHVLLVPEPFTCEHWAKGIVAASSDTYQARSADASLGRSRPELEPSKIRPRHRQK